MTVGCLKCGTPQKMYYGMWYCPKCKTLPEHYKVMVELAKKEVFDDIEKELEKNHNKETYIEVMGKKGYKRLKKKHLPKLTKK